MEIVLYILLGLIGIGLVYYIIRFIGDRLRKKEDDFKTPKINKQKTYEKNFNEGRKIFLTQKYMFRKELKVLKILYEILPKNYIPFPKVGIENLLEPTSSRFVLDEVRGKFVDFVIFEETTMKPILALDTFDNSFEDESLSEKEPALINVFEEIKLPFITLVVRNNDVDKEKLKQIIYGALKIENN